MSLNRGKLKRGFHLTIAAKLTAAICSIVAILLISSIVSILEFRRMSNYVSSVMQGNIEGVNLGTELSMASDNYNNEILSVVGRADSLTSYHIDYVPFQNKSDSLLAIFDRRMLPLADSLKILCDEYIRCSREIDEVIVNDFTDTREWYFTTLQPRYNNLRLMLQRFNGHMYDEIGSNSVSFDESFYRSIMPSVASVAVGMLLCLLLLFYLLVYYTRPLKKMLSSLDSYMHTGQPYNLNFDGDDEMQCLNGSIADIVEENKILKRRLKDRER